MTAQEKLAFFVVAFLVVPPSAYQRYFADLKRRGCSQIVKTMLVGVFLLAVPYFYDQLVGLDSKTLSNLLGVAIGACAYLVLIDVAWFAYKNYGPPSQRSKPARK